MFGEYAVLAGHPALLAAVDRHVYVEATPAAAWTVTSALFAAPVDISDFALNGPAGRVAAGVQAAIDLGAARTPLALHVDSSDLFAGARKLGFGSSAAVVVAVAGAVMAASGLSLSADPVRAFAACRDRHNTAQGSHGSGGDIAASLMGGLTWLQPQPLALAAVHWLPPIAIVTHKESAATPTFIAKVSAWKASAPAAYAAITDTLGGIARAAKRAVDAHDAHAFVAQVAAANTALRALGDSASAPICTQFHNALAGAVAGFGCAAKPAGAGGGDLSIIAAPSAHALKECLTELAVPSETLIISSGLTIYGQKPILDA